MYNILKNILLTCCRPFMKEKTKKFIKKRLEQDFSFLREEDTTHREKKEYIWIHCSSVGEVNLSESLVMKFYTVFKKNILLSVFTDTGYEAAKKKYEKYEKIKIIYFPIDDIKKIREILSNIKLKLLVLIETEIWFNLIEETKKNNARVIVVNGRISDKSFKNYKKIKFLLKNLLKKIDYFYMQSKVDSDRIIELGAIEEKVENTGNLKFDIKLEKYSEKEKEEYKKSLNIGNKKVFVAGSTRTGEEEILLDVLSEIDNYILVIVPRHLERISKIENLIKEKSFSYIKYSELKNSICRIQNVLETLGSDTSLESLRNLGEATEENTVCEAWGLAEKLGNENKVSEIENLQKKINEKFDIILVDEMGILKKLYSICDVSFVGGTLTNVGGHNLLEPLFYRKPLIFGTYLQNVLDISKEILRRKIGYQVKDTVEFVNIIKNIEKDRLIHTDDINNFFNDNKLLSLKIVEKENKIMNLNLDREQESTEDKKKDLWKHFFHSPRSNYNIYMMKLLDYPKYIIYDNEVMKENKKKWNEIFENDNPLALEIGSGSGNFVSQLAERNKDKNYLALELRFKRLCMSAKKCKRQNLNNIIFLRKRAEELLDFLGENEISELYINFPDPWEGNEKNRVIQESLFKNLEKIMKKDGMIFFKTDHDIYYSDVLDLVGSLENFEVIYNTSDLHKTEKVKDNIKTEFEELFLNKHSKNINYIEIKKTN